MPKTLEGKYRLREFVIGLFPYLETGSAVKKAIQKRQIKINNEVGHTGDWVSAGCEISYVWSYNLMEDTCSKINIAFEDNDLMVVQKPPGLSSNGNSRSFQLQLQGIRIKDSEGSLPFPYLVHRLDKATEGLMIAAKNIRVRRLLADMMDNHSIIKHYVLIVEGILDRTMQSIDVELDGKTAKTEIVKSVVLNTKDLASKVFVRIHTGRTHQIRRHFKEINHPIVGDNLYNEGGLTFGTGLLLCAYHLAFTHPITNEFVEATYTIPSKISKYLALER